MKVFTVGLEGHQQQEKGKQADALPEKMAPPPGYLTSTNIAMAPELARGTGPIIVRKSRGYKGILMVMLAVFLMAMFALTISEIAYNRQRDENFFRLRWAEMKQRLGYGGQMLLPSSMDSFEMYRRPSIMQLQLQPDLAPSLVTTSTTDAPPSTSSTDVPRRMIDPEEPLVLEPQQQGISLSNSDSSSGSSSSGSGSFEVHDPMEQVRDARLQFLRKVLKKIKEHAQQMGFTGEMQVSVIEMEPHQQQEGDDQPMQMGQPMFGNGFFPTDLQQQQPHPHPMFLQNNQIGAGGDEQQPMGQGQFFPHPHHQMPMPMPLFFQQQQQQQQWPMPPHQQQEDGNMNMNNQWPQQQQQQQWPVRPEMAMPFFRPQQQMEWPQQQPMMNGGGGQMFQQQFAMPPQPQPIEQPQLSFEGGPQAQQANKPTSSAEVLPNQQEPASSFNAGEVYGRKFGRMLQDIIAANRMQQQPQPQQQFQFQGEPNPFAHAQSNNVMAAPSMMMFPQQQGQAQQQQQQQQWPQPQPQPIVNSGSNGNGQEEKAQQQQALPFPQFPPQQRPSMIFFPLQQNTNQQQQQGVVPDEGEKRPFPFFKNFIAPEDRIQIEPPVPTPVVMEEHPDWSDDSNNNKEKASADASEETPSSSNGAGEMPSKAHLVDGNVEANPTPSADIGWTHQQQQQQQSGEVLISADSTATTVGVVSDSTEATRDPEDRFLTGPPDFSKQKGQEEVSPAEQPAPKRQPDMDLQRPVPIDTSVDFPAVKFPTTSIIGASTPEPQADAPKQGSNPVFFQVDDPVAIGVGAADQPQQQMPIRTVA